MFKIDNKKYNLVTYPDGKVTNSIDLNKVEILNELYTKFPFNKETDSKEKYKETIQTTYYEYKFKRFNRKYNILVILNIYTMDFFNISIIHYNVNTINYG